MSRFRGSGWLLIISASLLALFWVLFALFLPMQKPYISWVLDDDWTWINCIGFSGSLTAVLAVMALFEFKKRKGYFDYIAFAFAIIGTVYLTSILFFEAFILKGIALVNPELILLDGSFYMYPSFKVANIVGGISFSFGMIGLSVRMMKERTFRRWKLIMLLIASPLFGIVLFSGNIRLIGVLLFTISFVSIGKEMINHVRIMKNKGAE